MFIPVRVFEAITGATGISELVPATAAPLGDTARALIAFGFGASTFAILAALLMFKPRAVSEPRPAETSSTAVSTGSSFIAKTRERIAAYIESRRSGPVVTELSDLPKLRAGDAHPDAPPRRPISAQRDFAEFASEPAPLPVAMVVEPLAELIVPLVEEPAIAPMLARPTKALLPIMVDRLEAAVAIREEQLAKLEAIANGGKRQARTPSSPSLRTARRVSSASDIFEAVPSDPAKATSNDAMDDALRSALETLHRMNARTR